MVLVSLKNFHTHKFPQSRCKWLLSYQGQDVGQNRRQSKQHLDVSSLGPHLTSEKTDAQTPRCPVGHEGAARPLPVGEGGWEASPLRPQRRIVLPRWLELGRVIIIITS